MGGKIPRAYFVCKGGGATLLCLLFAYSAEAGACLLFHGYVHNPIDIINASAVFIHYSLLIKDVWSMTIFLRGGGLG